MLLDKKKINIQEKNSLDVKEHPTKYGNLISTSF